MKLYYLIILSFAFKTVFAQQTLVIDENFNDNINNWLVNQNENNSSQIKNGNYILENTNEKAAWFFQKLNVNPNLENFVLECKIRQTKGVDNYGYGIVWSLYNDNSSYQTFFITSNGMFKLNHYYNNANHNYVDWQQNSSINPMNKWNILKIEKNANIVTFYINDELIHKNGSFSYFGSKFGFYINNVMEVEVDYFKLTKSERSINFVENHKEEQPKIKLSSKINTTEYDEMLPVPSADEKTLYCVRKKSPENTGGSVDDIWFAKKDESGEWGELKNFGKPLNNNGLNFVVSVSPDNNSLIVANTYKEDGTPKSNGVSISRKTENGWEIPKEIKVANFRNDNQFVGFNMATDNKTLIMSIERPGEYGEKDICVSFLQQDGSWTEPLNLGNQINTFGDETTPFLAADGKTLYFSSTGHYGLGSYDIFMAKKLDDTWTNWSVPQNLGPSVNTQGSDLGFFMGAKGDYAYVSSGGDIYQIGNPSKPEATVLVKGTVYNSKTNQPMSANITYTDLSNNKNLGNAASDPKTGEFQIILPAGKLYSFLAQKNKFYSVSENIDLKSLDEFKEVNKNLYLSPIEKGEVIRLNNIFFETAKSELKDESFSELERLVKILNENPDLNIQINGHTDDVGSDESNLKLSENRANAVMNYLLDKKITKYRLSSKGFGETTPIKPNTTIENRAFNRRVEFKIL